MQHDPDHHSTTTTLFAAEPQDESVEQLLLRNIKTIPACLRKQVKEHVHNLVTPRNELVLQGPDLTPYIVEFVVSFLRLVQKQQASNTITRLSIERDLENLAGLQILVDFLQQQQGIDGLRLSFQSFGTSYRARQACRRLLEARNDWRLIDLRCCNFCSKGDMDMSFVTDGLQAQTCLQSFTLGHGIDNGLPPLSGAELVETLDILACQNRTLRTLVMRDWYKPNRNAIPEHGHAAANAMIRLLQTCRLEKFVWDVPSTAELYQDGSDMQQRFLAAMQRNETLLTVQLRRLSIRAPLVLNLKPLLRRNRQIGRVRKLLQHRPGAHLLSPALGGLTQEGSSALFLALASSTLVEHMATVTHVPVPDAQLMFLS